MILLSALILANTANAVPEAPRPDLSVEPLLAQEEGEELPKWSGSFDAGGSISTGNTERQSGNAALKAEYRREGDRWTIGFNWNYAQETNATTGIKNTTARRPGGGLQYDYFLGEKYYVLANAYAESDLLADVKLRSTAGVGYGYQFKETENWKLSAEIGAGYYNKKFYSGGREEYPNARLNYSWEGRFGGGETKHWNLAQDFNILPSLESSDQVYLKLDTRLRYDMSTAWFLQMQHVMDWDNTPAPGLERTDHRVLLSLGYSF